MPTRQPTHLRSFDYHGFHRYFVTWCCADRQPLFTERVTVDLVWAQFLRACERSGFVIVAYCFMPDHVHLLIEATSEQADAKGFFSLAKQFSGYAYAQSCHGRLWQRYCYEHVLRTDETTRRVARYIVENPVRAKLVANVQDYPFTGSGTHSTPELIEWAYKEAEPAWRP